MLKKIRRWLANRKEHRQTLKVCRSYWNKHVIQVQGNTLSYWEDSISSWVPLVKEIPYSYFPGSTGPQNMDMAVMEGLGINNLLYAIIFHKEGNCGEIKVYPLLVFCSSARGVWMQPVHSAEALLAVIGKKQYAHIRKHSRINWDMAEIM